MKRFKIKINDPETKLLYLMIAISLLLAVLLIMRSTGSKPAQESSANPDKPHIIKSTE